MIIKIYIENVPTIEASSLSSEICKHAWNLKHYF